MDEADERNEADPAFVPTQPGEPGRAAQPRALPRVRPGAGRCVESSCDLQRGLIVEEGLPADVAVDEWIVAWLRSACR